MLTHLYLYKSSMGHSHFVYNSNLGVSVAKKELSRLIMFSVYIVNKLANFTRRNSISY